MRMTFLDTFRLYRLHAFAKATEGLIMSCDILVMRRNRFEMWETNNRPKG